MDFLQLLTNLRVLALHLFIGLLTLGLLFLLFPCLLIQLLLLFLLVKLLNLCLDCVFLGLAELGSPGLG